MAPRQSTPRLRQSGWAGLDSGYRPTPAATTVQRDSFGACSPSIASNWPQIQFNFARDRLCIRGELACSSALFFHSFRESVCDNCHKQPCDGRLPAKMVCACRGRIPPVSSGLHCDSWNSRLPLCAWRTGSRADRYDIRRTALEQRGSQRFSSWFEVLGGDGSRRRLLPGAHPREEIPFSNGQTGLVLSTLQLCGRPHSPPLYHLAASTPSVRGIAPCVDPRGNPCKNGPRNGISRAWLIPLERPYDNPRTELPCGLPSEENESLCGEPAQTARA